MKFALILSNRALSMRFLTAGPLRLLCLLSLRDTSHAAPFLSGFILRIRFPPGSNEFIQSLNMCSLLLAVAGQNAHSSGIYVFGSSSLSK
jgi:hypothetical protein